MPKLKHILSTMTRHASRAGTTAIARSSLVGFAAAQAADSVRFAAGQLDGPSYRRKTVRNAVASTGTFVGGVVGSLVVPGAGTAIGGAIGGILGDLVAQAMQKGK